jgi:hypothetical protein
MFERYFNTSRDAEIFASNVTRSGGWVDEIETTDRIIDPFLLRFIPFQEA